MKREGFIPTQTGSQGALEKVSTVGHSSQNNLMEFQTKAEALFDFNEWWMSLLDIPFDHFDLTVAFGYNKQRSSINHKFDILIFWIVCLFFVQFATTPTVLWLIMKMKTV